MKKSIKTLSIYLTVGLMALVGTGCNPWLDLKPDNKQISDDYWQNKEELDAVVQSMYVGLRGCEEKFFIWGELRGDMLSLGAATDAPMSDMKLIKELVVLPDNGVASWEAVYKVIGRANAVLDYADAVLERDVTLAESLLKAYKGEAKFVRALCYFYLLRTFGDIPYVKNAFVTDRGGQSSFRISKSSKSDIAQWIKDDLLGDQTTGSGVAAGDWYTDEQGQGRLKNGAISYCKPGYGNNNLNKGRATRWAAYTLLADVALWNEEYNIAAGALSRVLMSNQYELMPQDKWYPIFSEGNVLESIFELQWSYSIINSFISGKLNNTSTWFKMSLTGMNMFDDILEPDVRGLTTSYLPDGTIWKYAGYVPSIISTAGNRTVYENNWIFYRFADVIYMWLEAQVELLDISSAEFVPQWALLNIMRARAGLSPIAVPSNKREALEIIMTERAKEFIAEGKRWFDIHRMAKKNNYEYKNYLVDILLEGIPAKDRMLYAEKLKDVNGYYLPIPKREIETTGMSNNEYILVQNPYYEGVN